MKIKQKKKKTRSYHLLTKVESGKCRRVTAAIDVIVTLCAWERQFFVTSSYFLYFAVRYFWFKAKLKQKKFIF